jgi:hypothetical protein
LKPKTDTNFASTFKAIPLTLGWEKETNLQLIPTLKTKLVVFNKAVQGDVVPMYLEEQVPVNKPPSVGKPNQLHNLWEQWHRVDCTNNSGRQPQGHKSTPSIHYNSCLILQTIPLKHCMDIPVSVAAWYI